MTDDWLITEHSANVALQLAHEWAVAVHAQARRIRRPHHPQERIPDIYLLVRALHGVLRAAEMAKDSIPAKNTKRAIQRAIGSFAGAIVVTNTTTRSDSQVLELVRDVLEHFDEYLCGAGRSQKRHPEQSAEERAQNYRVDFEGPADRPQLRIGPLRPAPPRIVIDLVTAAPSAANGLVVALHAAITQHQTSRPPTDRGPAELRT